MRSFAVGATLLLLIIQGAFSQTIREQYGITTYWSYGGGVGVYEKGNDTGFEEKTFGFKVHRAFVENRLYHYNDPNSSTPNGDTRVMFQPGRKGWYTDDYLELLGENGIERIWCTSGKMGFQNTIGKSGKVMPLNEEDNGLEPEHWWAIADHVQQIAIRYADDTEQYLDLANVFSVELGEDPIWYQSNTAKAGLGLLDAIEIQNEPNFNHSWSKASRTITPEQYAACFMASYESIRSVSQTLDIIQGGFLNGDINDAARFVQQLEILYSQEGKQMPTDFYLSFHWYVRNDGFGQGGNGTAGASPESVNVLQLGMQFDSLCQEYGLLGWYCTETGWAATSPEYWQDIQYNVPKADFNLSPSDLDTFPDWAVEQISSSATLGSSNTYTWNRGGGTVKYPLFRQADSGKSSTPIQQGFTQLESQGILMNRLVLIWGSLDYFKGVTFWHCRDYYDSGAFTYGGLNDKKWTPKPARQIAYDFIETYGDFEVVDYTVNGYEHCAELYNYDLDSTDILCWSDSLNYGDLTPVPTSIGDNSGPPVVDPPVVDPPVTQDSIIRATRIEADGLLIEGDIKIYLKQD